MRTGARGRSEHGFTLSELLVACAIIAFVMSGLLVMLQSGQQSYLVGSRQIEAQQNIRLAMDRIVDEIRNAGFCPRCETTAVTTTCNDTPTDGGSTVVKGFAGILPDGTTPATKFRIQNDWNGDDTISTVGTVDYIVVGTDGLPVPNQRGEQIIYTYDAGAGTLTRQEVGVDAAAVTLVTGITGLSFTYWDSGNPTAAPDGNQITTTSAAGCIRSVRITMTTRPSVQGAGTAQGRVLVTMADTVRLRNRGQ